VDEAFDKIRSDLLRLFELVEVVASHDFGQNEPSILIAFDGPTLLFRGDSLALLRDIQTALAGSALARGGPSRKAAETLLTRACSMSVVQGSEEAITWIRAELAEPPGRWLFAESILAYLPKPELQLGACRLALDVPTGTVPEPVEPRLREHLTPPLIIADVEARDEESARLLAREQIDEAVAILVLATGHRGSHGAIRGQLH
jgi:hypothetical protein